MEISDLKTILVGCIEIESFVELSAGEETAEPETKGKKGKRGGKK